MPSNQRARNIVPDKIHASKLSSDVLLPIFLLLRDWEQHSNSGTATRSRARRHYRAKRWDWIVISMVCRHWRFTALECSSLWTRIRNFHNHDKIRAFFERSGHAELDVDMDTPHSNGVGLMLCTMLEGHMWRVHKFKFRANRKVLDAVMSRLAELTKCAKAVELIYVYDHDEGQPYKWLPRSLPNNIPNVQLDSLTLVTLTLPCTSSIYHGLSELTIKNKVGDLHYCYMPTGWELIDTLEHCPNLRHLELEFIWPLFDDAQAPQIEERRIQLTQLKRLVLTGLSVYDCSKFIAMIGIGVDVDLRILFCDYDTFNPEPLPPNILVGRQECKNLDIILDENYLALQSKHPLDSSPGAANPGPNTTISTDLPAYGAFERTIHTLSVLFDHRIWQTADTITISFTLDSRSQKTHMNTTMWGELLDALPRFTKSLTIKFDSYRLDNVDIGLPEALSETNVDGHLRLPELEHLTLDYAALPPGLIEEKLEVLYENMRERSELAIRECRVMVLEQQVSRRDATPHTEIKMDHVFMPSYCEEE